MLILQEIESYNFDSVYHELRIVWHLLLYLAPSVRDGRSLREASRPRDELGGPCS
jgi:hypothetical protein